MQQQQICMPPAAAGPTLPDCPAPRHRPRADLKRLSVPAGPVRLPA